MGATITSPVMPNVTHINKKGVRHIHSRREGVGSCFPFVSAFTCLHLKVAAASGNRKQKTSSGMGIKIANTKRDQRVKEGWVSPIRRKTVSI